jgi:hypothetical protein
LYPNLYIENGISNQEVDAKKVWNKEQEIVAFNVG